MACGLIETPEGPEHRPDQPSLVLCHAPTATAGFLETPYRKVETVGHDQHRLPRQSRNGSTRSPRANAEIAVDGSLDGDLCPAGTSGLSMLATSDTVQLHGRRAGQIVAEAVASPIPPRARHANRALINNMCARRCPA